MSKQSASPVVKAKAAFSAGSFAALRSITGEGSGEPLRIALDIIDEDPDQPRKLIDDAELAPMVETIRSHGVLQPVGVHPQVDGRLPACLRCPTPSRLAVSRTTRHSGGRRA